MKLYSLKVKSLKIYNTPFPAIDDGAAVSVVRDSIKRGSEQGLLVNFEDLELFSLGAFDSKEGIKNAKPKKIIDLVHVPGLAEIVQSVRDVAKEVAENA